MYELSRGLRIPTQEYLYFLQDGAPVKTAYRLQILKGMKSGEFKPTHEFHLFDDSIIYVTAELRGD